MLELSRETIEGDGVRLREVREADADDIVAGCSDPVTQRFLPALPRPYTRADALWWIHEGAPSAWHAGGGAYAISDLDTDRLMGCAGINRVIGERHQGEIGYWVAPWARGRGVGRAGTLALTAWAFAHSFSRLELLTEPENAASQRVAIAAGYRYEGVRRAGGLGRDGTRHDLVVWARLPSDPAGPTPRPLPDLPDGRLTDGIVALHPLRAEDAEDAFALQTLRDVVATSVPAIAPGRAEVALRCARAESRWLAGERADLAIRDAATGTFAGEIGLYYQEPLTRQAMVGYSMLPAWRGRGYATRAVRLLAGWALRSSEVERLVAGTSPGNVGSQRVLERAGFVREGLLRGRLPAPGGGNRLDDIQYAMLAPRGQAARLMTP